ncbi:hypothetical protein MYX65_13175 [Acidobacteria bacterium AH-259-L09]|nr:hypothetical protein [Acidobacteria bacterium AH-259-L09]
MAKKDSRFRVLSQIPKDVSGGTHPDTKKIIEQIKSTKGRVLACKFKTPREAKNRMEPLQRAERKGYVKYKEARRKANMVYFKLR